MTTTGVREPEEHPGASTRTRTGMAALIERESLRVLKIWSQTIVFPTLTGLLYVGVFGLALGERIGRVDGVDYVTFVLPGVILMQVATQAYNNNSSSVFQSRSDGYIEDVLAAPIHAWQVSLALLWGGILRSLSVATLIIALSLPVADVPLEHPLEAVLLLAAVAVMWGSIGSVAGIWAQTWDHHMMIGNLVIVPLVFVGGVFYSVEMLPDALALATRVDPLFYQVQGIRHAFLGTSDTPFLTAFALTVGLAIASFTVQTWLVVTGWRLKE